MKGEHMPLGQFYEFPQKLTAEMRLRGPNHEDLQALLKAWMDEEGKKFKFLSTDVIRLQQRKTSLYLKAAEGAELEIALVLLKVAERSALDAQRWAGQMTADEDAAEQARGELLFPELDRQVKSITEQKRLLAFECGPEIEEFEKMIADFEERYPIGELHSITTLTVEEALAHPTREPARLALGSIFIKLYAIKEETNISPEQFEELKSKYKILFRAVGTINNGKVDHDR